VKPSPPPTLAGVLPVFQTPFHDDETIDGPDPEYGWSDGRTFAFRSVAPGTYTVFAQTVTKPPQPRYVEGVLVQQPPTKLTAPQQMWASAHVTVVSGEATRVSVSLAPTRSISGVVVFDLARPLDVAQSRLVVTLTPAPSARQLLNGVMPSAPLAPDGRFTIAGVVPGRYSLRVSGRTIKSAIIAGQDTLDFPYEFTGDRDVTDAVITLTSAVSELCGTLTDNTGKPAPGFTIVVVASDTRFWLPGSRRVMVTRPDSDGRYTLRYLPPGDYLVAAVKDLDRGAQYDPEFLRSLVGVSVPVTIMDGGKVRQDLRVK